MLTGPIIHVLARGGSLGLPGKHLLPLSGKPLIAHPVSRLIEVAPVYINTDDESIARVAQDHGAAFHGLCPAHSETSHPDQPFSWLEERLGHRGPSIQVLGAYPLQSAATARRIFSLLGEYRSVLCFRRLPKMRFARFRQTGIEVIDLPNEVYYFVAGTKGIGGQRKSGPIHLVCDGPEVLDVDTERDFRICEHANGGAAVGELPWQPIPMGRIRPVRWFPEWMWTLSDPCSPDLFCQARRVIRDAPYRRQGLAQVFEFEETP